MKPPKIVSPAFLKVFLLSVRKSVLNIAIHFLLFILEIYLSMVFIVEKVYICFHIPLLTNPPSTGVPD